MDTLYRENSEDDIALRNSTCSSTRSTRIETSRGHSIWIDQFHSACQLKRYAGWGDPVPQVLGLNVKPPIKSSSTFVHLQLVIQKCIQQISVSQPVFSHGSPHSSPLVERRKIIPIHRGSSGQHCREFRIGNNPHSSLLNRSLIPTPILQHRVQHKQ